MHIYTYTHTCVCMFKVFKPLGYAHCLARPCQWRPCTDPHMVTRADCSTNLHIDCLDGDCCPLSCYKPPTNLCSWPLHHTGADSWEDRVTGCWEWLMGQFLSAAAQISLSLSLISNLPLPPPSIALDRETSANKEGIFSCLLKDNSSFIFSFCCYCCS